MLLAFLIFVVLLSGLVAYSADTIARKAGRKHLRWFGLRPKTTALIVAVLSGMGISLFSVLAFGLLNRAAIRNIVQADQLRVELQQLKKDVAATNTDLKKVQQERDQANSRVQAALGQTASAQRGLQQAKGELQRTQAAQVRLRQEVARLQARTQQLAQLRQGLEAQAAKGQAALEQSRQALVSSQQREAAQSQRLGHLGQQLAALESRSVQAQQQAQAAEARAQQAEQKAQAHAQRVQQEAKRQAQQAQRRMAQLQAQTRQLEQGRAAMQGKLQTAQQELQRATQLRQAAQTERASAVHARDAAFNQRAELLRQWQQVRTQLAAATQQREAVRAEVASLRASVSNLNAQRNALQASLNSTRADLSRLEVDYSRTNSELSANRNLDLAYSRGELVYAGNVASVRNLPTFLVAVTAAAQKAGAKGNPAARLDSGQRAALESKLRGLNTSAFVQCRAAVNIAIGFPVDLTCDAKPQNLLYRRAQPITQASIELQRGSDALSAQVVDLSRSAVLALTSRGVPPEYITNQGLSDTERLDLLGKLAAQSGKTVTVKILPRSDVRVGGQVDLYAVVNGN